MQGTRHRVFKSSKIFPCEVYPNEKKTCQFYLLWLHSIKFSKIITLSFKNTRKFSLSNLNSKLSIKWAYVVVVLMTKHTQRYTHSSHTHMLSKLVKGCVCCNCVYVYVCVGVSVRCIYVCVYLCVCFSACVRVYV